MVTLLYYLHFTGCFDSHFATTFQFLGGRSKSHKLIEKMDSEAHMQLSKCTYPSYTGIHILNSSEGESSSLLSMNKSDFHHTRKSLNCHIKVSHHVCTWFLVCPLPWMGHLVVRQE